MSKTKNRPSLSVVVITKDEEKNIAECLESVRWAGEIIVVDAGSTDKTVAISRRFTKKIFLRPWDGYGAARNFGISKSGGEWVLALDADERVTGTLRSEIEHAVANAEYGIVAYDVPRKANFLGRWIKHGGWYPGRVTRLFRKNAGRFTEEKVHERFTAQGTVGHFSSDLLHYTDPDLFHYFEKFNRYTSLASEEMASREESFNLWHLLVRPAWMFTKMYIIRLGFLDGLQGFILCVLSSCYVFTKYAKLWEQSRLKSQGER